MEEKAEFMGRHSDESSASPELIAGQGPDADKSIEPKLVEGDNSVRSDRGAASEMQPGDAAKKSKESGTRRPAKSVGQLYLNGMLIAAGITFVLVMFQGTQVWTAMVSFLGLIAIGLLLPVLAFLPTIIAADRQSEKNTKVALINVFAGWTIAGWGVALWLALKSRSVEKHRLLPGYTTGLAICAFCLLMSLCSFIPQMPDFLSAGALIFLIDPLQAWLAVLVQRRIARKHPNTSFVGAVPAYFGVHFFTLTGCGFVLASFALVVAQIFAWAQSHSEQLQTIGLAWAAAGVACLAIAVLLMFLFHAMFFYFQLAKDLREAGNLKSKGSQITSLLCGLGLGLSLIWLALSVGGHNFLITTQMMTLALSCGHLWTFACMRSLVREWEAAEFKENEI